MTQHTITYDDATHQVVPISATQDAFDRGKWFGERHGQLEAASRTVPSFRDLMALSDKWSKEPGFCEFERNDFVSCVREALERYGQPLCSPDMQRESQRGSESQPVINQSTEREAFEAVFTKPPFEWGFERYGEQLAWPGDYQILNVQCAWEAWQARAALAQQPSAQSIAAVTFVNELAMGAYKPGEIEARAKEIARMAPLDVQPNAKGHEDAERYRWLRNESWAGYHIGKGKPQVAETVVFVERGCGTVKTVLAGEALDAAVDTASAAKGE